MEAAPSPSPRYFCVYGSLDTDQPAGISSKFLVRGTQEILPDNRKIEMFS